MPLHYLTTPLDHLKKNKTIVNDLPYKLFNEKNRIFGFANVDFHVNLHLAALWGGGGTHFELIEKSNNSKLKIPNMTGPSWTKMAQKVSNNA